MSLVSQSLDYKSVDVSYPTYQLSKVTAQLPLPEISISGGNESIYELPPKVMNLGKSILSFTATAPSSGTTPKFNWLHTDGCPWIREIHVYDRQGLFLAQVPAFNYYMKSVARKSSKIEDVATYDKPIQGGGAVRGYYSGIYCNNSVHTYRPDHIAGTPSVVKTNNLEPAYCYPGVINSATPVVNVQIPLERFTDTILSMNQDQYFGESIYLRILWGTTGDIMWKSVAADEPGNTPTAQAGDITISNLLLYTAIEQNPVIVNALMDKFKAGTLSYNIPYINMTTTGLSAGTNNLSVRFSRPHGKKLKKIVWSPFAAAGANNLKYDNNNVNAVKITSYFTMLNNVRTTQFDYNTDGGIQWLVQKDNLTGSALMSSNEYFYNFTHVEQLTGSKSYVSDPNLDEGLSLDKLDNLSL